MRAVAARTAFDARLEAWIAGELPSLLPTRPDGAVALRPIVVSLAAHDLVCAGWPAPWGEGDPELQLALHRRLASQPHGGVGLGLLSQIDIGARILSEHGGSAHLAARLAAALAGEEILALGLTEADCGSDLRGIATQARKVEGGWRLDGAKWGISNLAVADACIVLARTGDPTRPIGGFTLFYVPRTYAGVAIGPALDTAGHPGTLGQAVYEDVFVPDEAVVGKPGQGLLHLMSSLAYERVMIAARALGACEAMLAEGVAHARARETFGRPLVDNQHVQFLLASWRVGVLALESELFAVFEAVKRGASDDAESASLKHNATVFAKRMADELLQLTGGAGYTHASPAGRYWLDLPGLTLAGGSSEVMLTILARRFR